MDLFEELLTGSSSKLVDPETLEFIGQKAANMYLEKKASLNQAIVQLAGQHPELNKEHIHRITEFANTFTFQKMFENQPDKNVHFDVADPGVILRDLHDGGSPAHSGKTLRNSDYLSPPNREKDSFADLESGMQELSNRNDRSGVFGQGEPVEKVAHAAGLAPEHEGSANPVNDVYALHLQMQRSFEEISAAHESTDLLLKQAQDEFYKAVKHEVLSTDGAGLGGVVSAIEKMAAADVIDGEAMTSRLLADGISAELLSRQLTKTAGRIVNLDHPLAKSLSGIVKLAHDREVSSKALEELKDGMKKTASFLKSVR